MLSTIMCYYNSENKEGCDSPRASLKYYRKENIRIMDLEIAAIMTVEPKLGLLEKLLDKRINRAALDLVTPALPLLEKVSRLVEYKRLAANLAVMAHRIACALGGDAHIIADAAAGRYGMEIGGKSAREAFARARRVLEDLGIDAARLDSYKELPLYRAECSRLTRLCSKRRCEKFSVLACAAVCAPSRDGKRETA